MQRRINVSQAEAFPYPLFMVGDVQPARDFDRSTREQFVQAVDEATGVRVWEAEVIDSDPDTRKQERSFTVKVLADQQPVPPEAAEGVGGAAMRPVEFTGLQASPWLDSSRCNGRKDRNGQHQCKGRLSWSYRASGFAQDQRPGQVCGVLVGLVGQVVVLVGCSLRRGEWTWVTRPCTWVCASRVPVGRCATPTAIGLRSWRWTPRP